MSTQEKRRYSLFPKSLSRCIEPLTRPVFKSRGLAGSRIVSDWASIVGPQFAACCIPEKLSFPMGKTTGGTLTIAVENGFATDIQHMQPIILERLSLYFGYKAIDRLNLVPLHAPAEPPTAKLPPVSTVAVDKNAIGEVEDIELKAVLESFADTLSGKRS